MTTPADVPNDPQSATPLRNALYNWTTLANTLRALDLLGLVLSGLVAHFLRFGDWRLESHEVAFVYLGSIATIIALQMAKSYRPRLLTDIGGQLSALFVGGLGGILFVLVGGFVEGSLADYSRAWVLLTIVVGAAILIGNRVAISLFAMRIRSQGHLQQYVVLVGANDRAEKLIANIGASRRTDLKLVGIFDDRLLRVPKIIGGVPVIGTVDGLLEYVRTHRVDRIVVTLDWSANDRILALLKKLRTVPARVDLVTHEMVWQFRTNQMDLLADVPIITVANRRLGDQMGLLKRLEDIVLSVLILILVGPVMLLIALAIKLDGPGPVFFKQKRHGFNNGIFDVLKFRTMHVAKEQGPVVAQATKNDPRVTRIGAILRRYSLDELPQFLNVIQGTMSVVGPRPHAISHNVQYAAVIEEYFARHNVKPGITGWAQVHGLRGETDTDEKMRKRVKYDLYYIEQWSLLLDLKIVLMTAIVTIWSQENAY